MVLWGRILSELKEEPLGISLLDELSVEAVWANALEEVRTELLLRRLMSGFLKLLMGKVISYVRAKDN